MLKVLATATLSVLLLCPAIASADPIVYLASSGNLPQSVGWSFTQVGSPSISVSGGNLQMSTTNSFTDKADWELNLLNFGKSSGNGVFMDTTMQLLNVATSSPNRGVAMFEVEDTTHGLSGTTSEVDGYAQSDRIIWTNSSGAVVGHYMVDTSQVHDYRVELSGNDAFIFVDHTLVGEILNNRDQNGDPNQGDVLRAHFGDATSAAGGTALFSNVTAGVLSDGITPDVPVLPEPPAPGTGTTTPDNVYVFNNVPSGHWFDPPYASGFTYTMTSANLFTSILDFPTTFGGHFTVTAEGHSWAGQSGSPVDFLALLGHGVSTFTVSGIAAPYADAANPSAFPLQLAFDSPTASFTMQANTVPEPSSLALAGIGGLAVAFSAYRRRQQSAAI